MNRVALLCCSLWLAVACGGGAGRAAPADGPPPSGKHRQRGLVLVEAEDDKPKQAPPAGDGTSTPEIVKSVEED